MKAKTLYLVLCVLGIAVPYWQFIPWVVAHHGIPPGLFFSELFSTRIGAFFGMDVFVSAAALIAFARIEARRMTIKKRWFLIPALLLVGVSLALPLFLYLREQSLGEANLSRAKSAH